MNRTPWKVILFLLVCLGAVSTDGAAFNDDNDDAAVSMYYSANALYNRKLYTLSMEEYEAFIKKYPRHEKRQHAELGRALCLYALENFEDAAPALEKLCRSDRLENQQEIHNLLGQSLLRLKRPEEAQSAFSWATSHGDDDEQKMHAWVGWIEAQYRQSLWEDVIPNAGRFLKAFPDTEHSRRVRFQSAVARFELKRFGPARDALEALARNNDDSPMAQHIVFLLAECHRELGEPGAAEKRYNQAARKMTGAFTAEALYRLGFVRFNNNDFTRASNDFTSLLEKHGASPSAPSATLYLGRSFHELGNHREAERVLESIPPSSEVYAHARLWLARTHIAQQELAAAERSLAEALERTNHDPLYPDLLYEYGYAQMDQGRFEEAAQSFRRLHKRHGEHELAAEALWLQAFCVHKLGDFQASDRLCVDFLNRFGQSASAGEVGFLHGENRFLMERRAEALPLYARFVADFPDHFYAPSAQFRIAQVRYYQKEWSEALAAMAPLLEEIPESPFFHQLHFLEGDCHFNLENWEKAVAGFTRFVASHPDADRVDLAAFKAALAIENSGHADKAASVLGTFLDRFSKSEYRSKAAVQLGRLQYDAGNYPEARKAFRMAIDQDQDPYAIYYQGYVSLAEEKKDDALDRFSLFCELHPEHELAPDAMLQQAILLIQEEEHQRGRRILEELIASHGMHEATQQARFYLSVALARADEKQAAARGFEEYLNLYPASDLKDRALYEWAWCVKGLDDKGEAKRLYLELLNTCPDSALRRDAGFELAELEYEGKNFEASASRLEAMLDEPLDDEMRERVLYRLGWNYMSADQVQQAAHWFDTLLQDFPDTQFKAIALYQSGEAHLARQEYEEAYQQLLRLSELRDIDDLREQALLRLGECAAMTQRWQDSENVYRRFTREYPESDFMNQALFGIGWALENREDYGEAIDAYGKVVARGRFDETSARSQFQIGECFFSLKQYNEAVKALIKVEIMYAYPKWSARALLETGRALEIPGNKGEAKARYEELIQKYPDSDAASLARKKLADLISG